MADSLKALDSAVRQYGGHLIYVAVPGQTAYFADDYPAYLDSGAENTNMVLSLFKPDMAARASP
jgi:hypothetical protein